MADEEPVLHTEEEHALTKDALKHPNNGIENRICFELMTMPTRNHNEATAMFHLAPKIAKHLAERMDLMLRATGGR